MHAAVQTDHASVWRTLNLAANNDPAVTAIGAHNFGIAFIGSPRRERCVCGGSQQIPTLGHEILLHLRIYRRGQGRIATIDAVNLLRPGVRAGFQIPLPTSHTRQMLRGLHGGLAGLQGVFDLLAFGDVARNTEQPTHLARGIKNRAFGGQKHPRLPVGHGQSLFVRLGFSTRQNGMVNRLQGLGRRRGKQGLVITPNNGIERLSHHLGHCSIGHQVATLEVFDEHGIRCTRHHRIQQAPAGLGLGLRTPQHVAQQTHGGAIQDQHRPLQQVCTATNMPAVHRRQSPIAHAQCCHGGGDQTGPKPSQHGAQNDGQHVQNQHRLPTQAHAHPHQQHGQGQEHSKGVNQPAGARLLRSTLRHGAQHRLRTAHAGGRHRAQCHKQQGRCGQHKEDTLGGGQPNNGIHIGKQAQQMVRQKYPRQRQ